MIKIKKLKSIFTFLLVIGLPVSLYTLVYATNVERPEVATSAVASTLPVMATPTKPVVLAENSTVAKKPIVKKAPVKKKVVKKKKKKKERLIAEPALITAQTAPHTGR